MYALTIDAGAQHLNIDARTLDDAITDAQRALCTLGDYTAADYAGVCWLRVGKPVKTTIGATFTLRRAPNSIVNADECPRCGQRTVTTSTGTVCELCRDLERAPQGNVVRLFTPAPATPTGSLTLF